MASAGRPSLPSRPGGTAGAAAAAAPKPGLPSRPAVAAAKANSPPLSQRPAATAASASWDIPADTISYHKSKFVAFDSDKDGFLDGTSYCFLGFGFQSYRNVAQAVRTIFMESALDKKTLGQIWYSCLQ